MASNLEMIDAEASYQRLQDAVLAYISECDNPVPDYSYRRVLLSRLRQMTGAPEEPPPRSVLPITEGRVRKGGTNQGPSQIKKRPPPPKPTEIMKGGTPH